MRLSRRGFLISGLSAALWAEARAETAPGRRALAAGPVDLPLAPAPTPATGALGYDGRCPGPLLRVRAGDRLQLTFHNRLSEPTSLAFPGLRGPRAQLVFGALGDPPLAPGGSREIAVQTSEPGFQLYGALLGPDPALQMARGLYGPLIVDEPAPPEVDLEPALVIADWRLGADGRIADLGDASLGRGPGRIGAVVTADGAPAPFRLSGPPGGRVRLRLGNAATARALYLSIDGVKPLVVAVDGQPSAPFAPLHNLLPVGPGARFELMFDLPRQDGAIVRFYMRPDEGRSEARGEELILFDTAGAAAPVRPPIAGLPDNPRLPDEIELERALRADVVIGGGGAGPLTIAGVSAPARPLFKAPRGAPVTLAFYNQTQSPHTMRITGHLARLLHALDDGWDPYWRDIFIVPAGKTVHAAFVADNPGLWPLESTSPERRNAGLTAFFQVS